MKALSTLEFDKIVQRVAACATSAPGRRACEAILPYTERFDAERALRETADAMRRTETGGRISFAANRDFTDTFSALAIGQTPEKKTFLDIASFLECAERARAYGTTAEAEMTRDTLSDLFYALEPLREISAEIRRIVLSEDEIAPDASPLLKDIRREKQASEQKVREVLNRMVNGSLREYLQDPVVTMRGDRYCLPVRAEHKAKVNGIVHDQSSSGSTFFIEPAAVVELNNKIRTCEMREEAEIARILAALSAMTADKLDALKDNAAYMTQLDMIFARASYALETDASIPAFSDDCSFDLRDARHPLIDASRVVPVHIYLGKTPGTDPEKDAFRMLVITGPNTGGKTVTLKTAGLLTLMAQAGMAIPAAPDSTVGWFRKIHADVGDEQSIEQSLSTFSAHMTNTVRILHEAGDRDLCLFDELGAGTDPTEGAALAIAILDHLLQAGVFVMATTHYAELKVFAMTTPYVKNGSCEFDVRTLQPAYRLSIGTPGASNAFAISEKLGLDARIIENAHAQIDVDKARMETLIADLEGARRTVEEEKNTVARYKEEVKHLEERLRIQSGEMDALGEELRAAASREAEEILADAKRFADETIRALRRAGAPEEVTAGAERTRTALNEKLAQTRKRSEKKPADSRQPAGNTFRPGTLLPGTPVRVVSMGLEGTTDSKPDKDGNVFVVCGVMRMKVAVSDLAEAEKEKAYSGKEIAKRFSMRQAFSRAEGKEMRGKTGGGLHAAPAYELNLIGKNTDDALQELEKYLDDAYLAHVPSVRIVHGKGTGTLRNAVQNHLKRVKYVKSFKTGEYGEGDAGVTVVRLKG